MKNEDYKTGWNHGVLTVIFILLAWAIVYFMLSSCSKPPLYDPNCGVISYNQKVNDTWVVGYKWNDGTTDTILWYIDIVSQPGDTICKLLPVDLDELNCDRP